MKRILPILVAMFVLALAAHAEDVRRQPLKDLNGYFPFNPPASLSDWEARKESVRRQILVAAGLWPLPTKTPLNAVIHGQVDCDQYTVEKVYFESAPGMVSTAMQGGCTCENASILRVNTGNVEFAALFAPKPQGMNSADDWTKEMATKGFPELQQIYTAYGAKDKVFLQRGEHFPHNYNAVTRSAFYTFLNKHFKLGQPTPTWKVDKT